MAPSAPRPVALVTRPREDAEGTAAELRARGFDVLIEPVLDVVPLEGATVDLAGVQGLLVTSANGIRALAAASPERNLPVWAVGDASARAARDLGYRHVESAGGDVETLAALVRRRVDPARGALVHAAGTVVAGDLAALLAGYEVRRKILYEARTATRLSAGTEAALAARGIACALFFSPRSARTFATLAQTAGLADRCAGIATYALSAAVAQALAPLALRTLRVAPAPTQAALLAALDEDLKRPATAARPGEE